MSLNNYPLLVGSGIGNFIGILMWLLNHAYPWQKYKFVPAIAGISGLLACIWVLPIEQKIFGWGNLQLLDSFYGLLTFWFIYSNILFLIPAISQQVRDWWKNKDKYPPI